MSKLVELRGQLEDRRAKLAKVFEEAGPDYDMAKVASIDGDSAAKAAGIKALNDEMTDLSKQIEELEGFDGMKNLVDSLGKTNGHPGHPQAGRKESGDGDDGDGGGDGGDQGDGEGVGIKQVVDAYIKSPAYTQRVKDGVGPAVEVPYNIKTLFQTSAGWAVRDPRIPRVQPIATRPLAVVDIIPDGTTSASSVIYMEETTFTNNAAETAEGAAKPEAALALTEQTEPVRKIAVWIPVTDEQLDDVPQVRSYLENRLGFMVRQRLDSQLLVGNGTAPNLSGITDRAGIQTQAKGADPTPDAVFKAMMLIVSNAFAEPNGAVFHPLDWQDIRLLRTTDGVYIWGNPSDAGPERIFGLPVVVTTGMTQNTALVGDFQQCQLFVRSGLELQTGFINDDFQKNRVSIRAELRVAFAVYRPAAFATVTGI